MVRKKCLESVKQTTRFSSSKSIRAILMSIKKLILQFLLNMKSKLEGQLKQNKYRILKFIAQGQFSEVYLAQNILTNEYLAVKCTLRERFQESNGIVGQLITNEINALQMVESPNVVKYYDNFRDDDYQYLVEEYVEGSDLETCLKERKTFPESEAIGLLKQLLNGLKGLHQKFIIHRDLKPANILMHNNCEIKIADLGFCIILERTDQTTKLCLGTYGFMAPEVFEQKSYGLAADIFSAGCIFYNLLFGEPPFQIRNMQQYGAIMKAEKVDYKANGIRISNQCQELLQNMLKYDWNQRINFSNLYNHPLIRQNQISQIGVSRIQMQAQQINIKESQKFYQENEEALNLRLSNKKQDILRNTLPKQNEAQQNMPHHKGEIFQPQNFEEVDPQNQYQQGQQTEWQNQQVQQSLRELNRQTLERNNLEQDLQQFYQLVNQQLYISNTLWKFVQYTEHQNQEENQIKYQLGEKLRVNLETIRRDLEKKCSQLNLNLPISNDFFRMNDFLKELVDMAAAQMTEFVDAFQQRALLSDFDISDLIIEYLAKFPEHKTLHHHLLTCTNYLDGQRAHREPIYDLHVQFDQQLIQKPADIRPYLSDLREQSNLLKKKQKSAF